MAEKEENNVITNDEITPDELIKGHDPDVDLLKEKLSKVALNEDDNIETSEPAEQAKDNGMDAAVLDVPHLYCRQSTQVGPKSEENILLDIIQKAESNHEMRFSTVLCTGLPKTGKTSFCNLIMDSPSVSSSTGDFHTAFIKKSTDSSLTKETNKWRVINLEELNKLIDALNLKKSGSLRETWDVLFLLDVYVPAPALCLLPDSVVTFVTYKMLGEDFELNDPCEFIKNKKRYSKFLKEFLSSLCFKKKIKKSEFPELKINTNEQKFYIAFVGTLDGSSSEESYTKEAKIVHKSLHIIKEHINCDIRNFPLPFWYTEDKNQYLHLVNVTNHKEKHFKKVKSSLEDIVAKASTYKVPVSWMLFYFKIKRFCISNKTSVIEYTFAYENLWRNNTNFSEDELKLVLKFFHSVGALLYFHSIKGMENFVVMDFLWLFDNLKYLHSWTTKDNTCQYDYNARLVLKYEGELMTSMIDEMKFDKLGKVKPRDFLNLLENLRVFAPVNQENYFIPSILDSHEDRNVFGYYGELKSFKPLLITLSSGSLHHSIFCYLTAHMTDNLPRNWSKPKYDESNKRQHTFKDLVTFCVSMKSYICHVSILDKTFFLEIRLYSKSEGDCPTDLHLSVFKFIQKSLKIVLKESLHLPSNLYKHGFLCCRCECNLKPHLMVIKDHSNYKIAYCSKTDEAEVLDENYTVWFNKHKRLRTSSTHEHGQATADSYDVMTDESTIGHMIESMKSATISQEITQNPNNHTLAVGNFSKLDQSIASTNFKHFHPALKDLHRFKKDVGEVWFDLGVQLVDECDVRELRTIKQNYPNNSNLCCTEMFDLWHRRYTLASWMDLINALNAIQLNNVAENVTQFCEKMTQLYENNLRIYNSTPADEYDRSARLYFNYTSPPDPVGCCRCENSIRMSAGEVMKLEKRRLDAIKESATSKKK